jgi:xanthine dehydrogenase molybdenum-binding subunit
LDIRDGRVYVKEAPQTGISVAEVCEDAYIRSGVDVEDICGRATYHASHNAPPFAAFFAEVEVDTETGTVGLLKILTAGDVGTAINPMTVEGHFEGCMQMFGGYALTEDWCINKETGVLETDSFATYKMFSQLDMPKTEVMIMDNPEPTGPYGAKGAAEMGGAGIASAIANAIYDAVGVQINDLPMTPERIVKALKGG